MHPRQKGLRLLHAEGGHELHTTYVAHAEDAPARRLNCAHIRACVTLRISGDIGQGGAWRLQEQAAHGGAKRVVGKRATQRDMRSSPVHHSGTDAGRVPRGLVDAAGNRGGGQQSRFETDSRGGGSGGLALGSIGVNHLKRAGKCSFHWEREVHIGEISCAGRNGSHVYAVGKALRIGAELQDECGVGCRRMGLEVSGASIGGGIHSDNAYGRRISAHCEEPG